VHLVGIYILEYGYVTCLMHTEPQDPSQLQKNCLWNVSQIVLNMMGVLKDAELFQLLSK
jgi:hypothetical protein